jgi:hypothetical protein
MRSPLSVIQKRRSSFERFMPVIQRKHFGSGRSASWCISQSHVPSMAAPSGQQRWLEGG